MSNIIKDDFLFEKHKTKFILYLCEPSAIKAVVIFSLNYHNCFIE